ncbi:MAG: glycoside hydrolase family 2 TIM barrel-domain containing protein [Thalassotalea sp.]
MNIHHDGGLVGAAVPKGVWQRRLSRLKQAGVNAIRTAHNPPSEEFLTLCDEMGLLVQNEAFDEWDNPKDKRKNFNQAGEVDYITQSYNHYFTEWAERDIKAMIMRDRNHPSIIQWSIGNEIEWTYPRYTNAAGYWNKDNAEKHSYYWDLPPHNIARMQATFAASPIKGPELSKSAEKLSRWVKELDTTRPVTANLVTPTVSHFSGYSDVLDIIGYSYRQVLYNYGHKNYPEKMILGSENWVQWHEWQKVIERDFIPGMFVWTGINYLGESNGKWPKKGSNSGMLDFAGFTKPSYHMMKTVWHKSPHLYISSQTAELSNYSVAADQHTIIEKQPGSWQQEKWGWREVNEHWNYQAGELVIVEVYSNIESIELFLNERSLGIKNLTDNPERILKWAVPFQAGTLTARAANLSTANNNAKLVEAKITTATAPVAIQLSSDKTSLSADGYQVAHIVAQLIDKKGNPVQHIEQDIHFNLSGKIKLLGVDNGAADNIQQHQNNHIVTHQGKALMIVQSKLTADTVIISANAGKLSSNEIIVQVKAAD